MPTRVAPVVAHLRALVARPVHSVPDLLQNWQVSGVIDVPFVTVRYYVRPIALDRKSEQLSVGQ
jgi:hypothetical protein